MGATIIGLLIALFGPMLLAITVERFSSPESPSVMHVLAMGVYVTIVAIILFSIIHYEHLSLQSFCFQTVTWELVLAALSMYVFAPAAYWILARFKLESFKSGHLATIIVFM